MPSAAGKLNARRSGSVLSPKGQTYEKQLEIELRRGYAEFVIEALQNYFEKTQSGEFDFWGTMTAIGPLKHLRLWNDLGGRPENDAGRIAHPRAQEVGFQARYAQREAAAPIVTDEIDRSADLLELVDQPLDVCLLGGREACWTRAASALHPFRRRETASG